MSEPEDGQEAGRHWEEPWTGTGALLPSWPLLQRGSSPESMPICMENQEPGGQELGSLSQTPSGAGVAGPPELPGRSPRAPWQDSDESPHPIHHLYLLQVILRPGVQGDSGQGSFQ